MTVLLTNMSLHDISHKSKVKRWLFFLSEEIIFPGELSEPSGSVVRIGIVNNRHSSTCRQEQARMTVQGMRYFFLMVVTCSWEFVPPLPC